MYHIILFIIVQFVFCLYQITLPLLAGLLELHPELIYCSAVMQTIGLLSPLIVYMLSSYIISQDYSQDESWADVFNILINVIIAIGELLLRTLGVVMSWVYYSEAQKSVYIINIIISSFTSGTSLVMMIYTLLFFIPVIQQYKKK